MRAALLSAGSVLLTLGVVGNAYYHKKQFYPSVVYITKSNPSMGVIYIQAFVLVLLLGKLMRKIFFGQLRAAETEHLIERSWYAVTETCLAFTVFRDDFSPKFVALFTLLLFLKCFHWLAEDRVDYMERSPVISLLFHIRVSSLLILLAILDFCFVNHAYQSTVTKGASVQLVFGFEYAILLSIVFNILMKYILHFYDLQSENPWENKAVFLLYSELVMGFFKVVLYLLFMTIMIKIHTFPLFAIRPMYLSLRAFKKAVNDVIMSRRAIRNMNTLYPDATAEELATMDNVCIICREEMSGSGSSKKLPCNHIFHASCLRSWFQRQQTCPTCRMDVLRVPAPAQPAQNAPVPGVGIPGAQQQQPQAPNIANWPGFLPNAFPGVFPFMMPPVPPQQQQPAPQVAHPANAPQSQQASAPAGGQPGPSTSSGPSTSAGTQPTNAPPLFMPPFPCMPFFLPPPPPIPAADLSSLSVEELQAMEGQERENLEARIRCLRNIQTMLDGAVLQMQQYSSLVASMRSVPVSTPSQNNVKNSNPSTKTESGPTMNGHMSSSEHSSHANTSSSTDPAEELRRRRLEYLQGNASAADRDDNREQHN
ncbi:E3 ubiquitin-protein ligase synoviolin [Parasteatoda tepidariorum]|uniref:E3 ubiquitin-protein ligase synoviolin n=1 Tax=Parasteatoda tepidariorum TaxID=114398 RepID=UPI00077FE07B|nr:E3 ubiquitin-protein ligase synoviolin [Parasteatoda tepidariorum]XP_042903424.1 E3 ubiquitin-protein ligase synoviolin [Parasteatoda tepidariorum]